MKRFLPVLLGAFAGAVGTKIWFWFCTLVVRSRLPVMAMTSSISFLYVLVEFTRTNHGRALFVSSAVLGAWSVILWRGERTFWPRLGSALCSLGAMITPLWIFKQIYDAVGFSVEVFWLLFVYYFPILLWAFGLFFVAVLARRRQTIA